MKCVGTVAAEGQFASAGQNGSNCDGPDVQHEHFVLSRYRCADGHRGQSMCRWPQGLIDVLQSSSGFVQTSQFPSS